MHTHTHTHITHIHTYTHTHTYIHTHTHTHTHTYIHTYIYISIQTYIHIYHMIYRRQSSARAASPHPCAHARTSRANRGRVEQGTNYQKILSTVSYYREYTEPLTLRTCPKFGRGCNIETLGVYGGVPKGMQMRRLNLGVQVICRIRM